MSRNTSKHSAIQAGPAGTSATLTPLRQVLSTQTRELAARLQAERNTETAAAQDRALPGARTRAHLHITHAQAAQTRDRRRPARTPCADCRRRYGTSAEPCNH